MAESESSVCLECCEAIDYRPANNPRICCGKPMVPVAKLKAKIDRLQAIVARLPTFEDGPPVVPEAPAHTAAEAWLRTALGRATLRSDDMRLALERAFRVGYVIGTAAAEEAKGGRDA